MAWTWCLPTAVRIFLQVARPLLFTGTRPHPAIVVHGLVNRTVPPSGTGVIVAVRVTFWPTSEGLGEEDSPVEVLVGNTIPLLPTSLTRVPLFPPPPPPGVGPDTAGGTSTIASANPTPARARTVPASSGRFRPRELCSGRVVDASSAPCRSTIRCQSLLSNLSILLI